MKKSGEVSGPIRWTTLVLAGGAAALGQALPAQADGFSTHQTEQVWLVAGESGEGGEAGAVGGMDPELAELARLALVEGHMIAAVQLYEKGFVDEAVGLAGHPEAEMMDEIRAGLERRGAADFTAELEAVGEAMAEGAGPEQIEAMLSRLSDAIAVDATLGTRPARLQFQAIRALVQAAGDEYAGSIEGGAVTDLLPYHEAHGFVRIARRLTDALSQSPDAAVAAAAQRSLAALDRTNAAFGDIAARTPLVGDPSLFYGAAAEIEIAALRLK